LASDSASEIVRLKHPKFSALLDELQDRWDVMMPDALYTEERVNRMLVELEDTMIFGKDPATVSEEVHFFWQNNEGIMPLPIMGLEYTLSLYFPTTPIDFSNITRLYLINWSLTGMYFV
jgi:hypothetical protein